MLFYLFIAIGCIIACITVYLMIPHPSDEICMAIPWTLGVGVVLVLG